MTLQEHLICIVIITGLAIALNAIWYI